MALVLNYDDGVGNFIDSLSSIDGDDNSGKLFTLQRLLIILVSSVILSLLIWFVGTNVLASNTSELLDIFDSGHFRGTMAFWNSFSFLRDIVQFVISGASTFSLAGQWVIYAITIMYKAIPTLWDKVSEIKNSDMSGSAFGYQGLFTKIKDGSVKEKGLDIFITVALSFLLDIKALSLYGDNVNTAALGMNLDQSDSLGNFMVKSFVSMAVSTTLLCVLYNGTLTSLFGNFAELGCHAFDRVVTVTTSTALQGMMNKLDAFKSPLTESGTVLGKFQANIFRPMVRDLNSVVVGNNNVVVNQKVADATTKWVEENITYSKLSEMANITVSDQNVKEFRLMCDLVRTEETLANTWNIKVSDILGSDIPLLEEYKEQRIRITLGLPPELSIVQTSKDS